MTVDGVTCPVISNPLNNRDTVCIAWPDDPGFVAATGITLRDVAAFAPTPGRLVMEPNGWAVLGSDANFYGTATTQTVSGTLLGSPVRVRFTPVAFGWDYGDGTTKRTGASGSSWAASGLREFSTTPTGHRYAAAGDYTARLTVSLRAEFTFGDTWTTLPGTLDLPVAPIAVHVATADTLLVDHPCLATGGGTGC